jgi:hypothetical protein
LLNFADEIENKKDIEKNKLKWLKDACETIEEIDKIDGSSHSTSDSEHRALLQLKSFVEFYGSGEINETAKMLGVIVLPVVLRELALHIVEQHLSEPYRTQKLKEIAEEGIKRKDIEWLNIAKKAVDDLDFNKDKIKLIRELENVYIEKDDLSSALDLIRRLPQPERSEDAKKFIMICLNNGSFGLAEEALENLNKQERNEFEEIIEKEKRRQLTQSIRD